MREFSFEQIIDFAAASEMKCVEIMYWTKEKRVIEIEDRAFEDTLRDRFDSIVLSKNYISYFIKEAHGKRKQKSFI